MKKWQREQMSYVEAIMKKSKVKKVWEALKEARAVRTFYQ